MERNLTSSQLRLVERLQKEFEPVELAAIFAHLQGARETNGPATMSRMIVAAFGDGYMALNKAMDEADV